MAMPDRDAEWASELKEVYADINNDGIDEVLLNKREPNSQWRKGGYLFNEEHPADYLNYEMDLLCQWQQFLRARYIVGDTHTTTTAEDAATISVRLGGTWVLVGTESLAGETNNVFRKTV